MRHEIIEFLRTNGPHTVLQIHKKIGGNVHEIANEAFELVEGGDLYFEVLDLTFWYARES